MNLLSNNEVPMGFGMALAQDLDAMNYFSSLSSQEQQALIEQTHQIQSKQEMQAFVHSLAKK